ncbi:MAG: hypothetical protein PUB24_05720 [Lachnospiraceae bacterium]|nr:hypothetical protein [Lachnospiraceae bacterium]MDD6192561.1 hypothetical protein [Lachnospiraceae bacterium]MDY4794316.1 hypothetical protein [Pararoseburia sp.]
MLFFGKRRKKEQKIDEAFEKVYQEIETIENWDDPKKLEHYILDSCEQIIGITKEIEGERAEYRIVTAYLTDIQSLEKLPEEQAKELKEVAANIVELNNARTNYLNSSHNITEEQFMLMEQEEEDMPLTIRRMLEHERYQAAVKKDKNILEAQKSQWEIERDEIKRERKLLKNLGIALLILYGTLLMLLFVAKQFSNFDLTIPFLVLLFVGAFGTFGVYIRTNMLKKDMRIARQNYNKSVNLLNVVHMKYANVTKSVEYTKEKFGVHSSTELNYVWDQYVDAVKEKERFLRNNDDLEYFNGRLMRLLSKINLYDKKIWLSQTKALVDTDEMTEIKHNLVKRRQKIRDHIEENKEIVKSERKEIDRLMAEHEHYVPEIVEIIKSVDRLCSLDEK